MADQEDQVSPIYSKEDMAAFEQYEKELADYTQQAKASKEHKDAGYALYPHTGAAIGAAVPLAGAATNKLSDLASKGFDALNRQPAASAGQRWAEAVGGPGGKTVDEAVKAREIQMGLKPGEKLLDGIVVDQATYDKEMADRAAKRAAQSTAKEATEGMNPKELDLLQRSGLLRKVLVGAGAGFDLGDAYRRYKTGDTRGAVISGLGALGYPISKIPYPPAEVAGYGLMFGAPALNQLLDKPEEKAKGGLATLKKAPSHFAKGGEAGVVADTLGAIQDAIQEAKAIKASEALAPHEGKVLNVTQSDRMRSTEGDLGGPGFSKFQLSDPKFAEAKAAWAVGKQPTATRILNLNAKYPEGQAIWTPQLGSETQHQSNQHVYDALTDEFLRQARLGNLSPELRDKMNDRLLNWKEYKGMFPEDFDISNPEHIQRYGNTFDRRRAIAEVTGGKGVGKTKSQIYDYPGILQDMADPMTVGAPTYSLGTRLFNLTGDVEHRPDIHSAFPYLLKGQDLGVSYSPVPMELGLHDWVKAFKDFEGRDPTYMDINRFKTIPNQQITEDYLTRLQKAGYAKGGEVGTGLDALSAITDAIKEAKATPPVNRIDMNFKDVTKRVPEVTDAFAKLTNGEIGHNEYEDLVNKYKPVTPFNFIPTPATREEAINSLRSNQKDLYGIPSQTLQEGHPVGLRLDIPAYRDYGTWVPTVHEQKSGFGAGPLIGHESVAHITDPTFGMSQEAAASIASGKPKGTIATIKGNWKPTIADEAVAKGQEYLNNPDWIQVGMDPERHSYFYDRTTMEPVTHAEEALQIGPLVLAKKPKYGKKEDFKYADGGPIEFTNKYGTSVGQDQFGNQVLPQPTELDELKGMLPDRSTIQAIPKATSILGNKIAEEAKREWDKSGWRSIPDIALNTGTILGGSISDLASGFSPSLNKGEPTNPALGVGQEKEKPNFLGSEQIHDYLRNKGITKEDYPLAENALMLATPYAGEIPGMISKGVKATEGLPVGMSIKDVSPRFTSNKVQFTSPLSDAIEGHKMENMPGEQWSAWLRNQPASVKKEAESIKLHNRLEANNGNISKEDMLKYINSQSPRVYPKILDNDHWVEQHPEGDYYIEGRNSDPGDRYADYNDALAATSKYNTQWDRDELKLPGGDNNYREILIKMDHNPLGEGYEFTQKHYPKDTNLLAHMRINDRTSAEGKRALFLEELQSDWAQNGRKSGFGDFTNPDDIPNAPYVKDTKDWTTLGLKHAIKDAIENNKEQVAWTTGAQQNVRNAKEYAPRGMEEYYDKIMHQSANDLLKQLGAKERVRPIEFDLPEHYPTQPLDSDRPEYFDPTAIIPAQRSKQWGFDISPELRQKILNEGLPKFKKGGKISKTQMRVELDNFKGKKYG